MSEHETISRRKVKKWDKPVSAVKFETVIPTKSHHFEMNVTINQKMLNDPVRNNLGLYIKFLCTTFFDHHVNQNSTKQFFRLNIIFDDFTKITVEYTNKFQKRRRHKHVNNHESIYGVQSASEESENDVSSDVIDDQEPDDLTNI